MPRIQSEADEEWEEVYEDTGLESISRSTSVTESECGPPAIEGLPGFAKASDLHKKRSVEIEDEENLEDQLFPIELPNGGQGQSPRSAAMAEEEPAAVTTSVPVTEPEETWVPRKRLNRDLSRHNSANVSVSVFDMQVDEDRGAQVLDSTPRITNDITSTDFWTQLEQDDRNKRPKTAAITSPPRGPVPKASIAANKPSQAGPSRCRPAYSSFLRACIDTQSVFRSHQRCRTKDQYTKRFKWHTGTRLKWRPAERSGANNEFICHVGRTFDHYRW